MSPEIRVRLLPVLAGLAILASGLRDARAELPPDQIRRIESLVTRELEKQHIPGLSVAIAVENRVQWARGFGLADVENRIAVTADSKFRTASIAKSLTAVAAMKLVEEGKLDLDQPVQTYLPDFPPKKWPITSRQLLGHLAGVRHYRTPGEAGMTAHFPTVQVGLAVFADDPLLHEPGTAYVYSSFGFNLLGAVLEKASGESFEALLQRTVLTPAGMTSTCIDSVFEIIPQRVRGYQWLSAGDAKDVLDATALGLKPDRLYNARLHDTSSKIPGGGLLSTSTDLVRLAIALNGEQVLKQDSIASMWTTGRTTDGKATQYGLGWRIESLNGDRLIGHSGGQAGTSTYLLTMPDRKAAVAVMSNLQGASLRNLATSILTTVQSVPSPETAENAVSTSSENTPPAAGYEEIARRISEFVDAEIAAKKIPAFSVSLVDGDRVVWARGFGTANAAKNLPATAGSLYRVGSVSKLFTDLAVMQYVQQGKLDLDAEVQAVLPGFAPTNPFGGKITLRRVMSHKAGLVREPPIGNYFDPEQPTQLATTASLNRTTLVYPQGNGPSTAMPGSVWRARLWKRWRVDRLKTTSRTRF